MLQSAGLALASADAESAIPIFCVTPPSTVLRTILASWPFCGPVGGVIPAEVPSFIHPLVERIKWVIVWRLYGKLKPIAWALERPSSAFGLTAIAEAAPETGLKLGLLGVMLLKLVVLKGNGVYWPYPARLEDKNTHTSAPKDRALFAENVDRRILQNRGKGVRKVETDRNSARK